MHYIGIDIGTSSVKAFDGENKVSIPTLCLRKFSGGQEILVVGMEALTESQKNASALIHPIVKGKITNNEEEVAQIVKEAILKLLDKEKTDFTKVNVIIGLSRDAMGPSGDKLAQIVSKKLGLRKCTPFDQTVGTLAAEIEGQLPIDLSLDGGVVSIGHGTSEVIAYVENDYIAGGSSEEFACDKILRELRPYSQYYPDYIKSKKTSIQQAAIDVASQIAEKIAVVKSQALSQIKDPFVADRFEFRFTGGGLLMPFVKDALEEKLGHKLKIAEDVIYSNAIGLQKFCEFMFQER